ncbi:MAG TPA: alpha/beta hydrolase [Gemmatimonadaceae bacterium]|nr:alpha/beta hydrolase [Gemmatimonadaceae bacterium]
MPHVDDDLIYFALHGAAPLPTASAEGHVEFASARVWYATYGNITGDAVVLLHGAFDNSEDWGYQVPALVASGHRAIVIDNRGRGRSTLGTEMLSYELMASEVLAVMDALDISKFSVVGWSDGATIALILAMQQPSRIASVFAFGGSMDLSGVKDVDPSMQILGHVFGRAKSDYARLSPEPAAFDVMRQRVDHMMRTQPNYTAPELAAIRTRVAIVVGKNDEFIKPEHTDYLIRTIPGAQGVVLPNVSHFAMMQRPEEFNRAMLEFLDAR